VDLTRISATARSAGEPMQCGSKAAVTARKCDVWFSDPKDDLCESRDNALNRVFALCENYEGSSNFQPFFYWACPKSAADASQCDYGHVLNTRDNIAMRWSFNFDTRFQGTSQKTKQYYVTMYYPGR
jgi:hypothetical protein